MWVDTSVTSPVCLVMGRTLRSVNLPVCCLLRGQKSAFLPCRGDSLNQFMWNLAWPSGIWVRLAMQNFTSMFRGMRPPKHWKFPLFGNTDRFIQILRAYMRPTTLHKYCKFDMIRFTGYGVIAEKLHVSHLPWIFRCTLQEKLCVGSKNDTYFLQWIRSPIPPSKVWGDQTTHASYCVVFRSTNFVLRGCNSLVDTVFDYCLFSVLSFYNK